MTSRRQGPPAPLPHHQPTHPPSANLPDRALLVVEEAGPQQPPSLSTPLQVRRVLKLLETPYGGEAEAAEPEGAAEASEVAAETSGAAGRRRSYSSKPPLWAAELCVT